PTLVRSEKENAFLPFLHDEAGFLFSNRQGNHRGKQVPWVEYLRKRYIFRLDRRDGCEERVALGDGTAAGPGPDFIRLRCIGGFGEPIPADPEVEFAQRGTHFPGSGQSL